MSTAMSEQYRVS